MQVSEMIEQDPIVKGKYQTLWQF